MEATSLIPGIFGNSIMKTGCTIGCRFVRLVHPRAWQRCPFHLINEAANFGTSGSRNFVVCSDCCHICAFFHSRIHENDEKSRFGSLIEDIAQPLRIDRRNNESSKFTARDQRFDNINLILNRRMASGGEGFRRDPILLGFRFGCFDNPDLKNVIDQRFWQNRYFLNLVLRVPKSGRVTAVN